MGEIKTKPTDLDIDSFLNSVEPEIKRTDCIELKKVFDSVVKEKATLWNNNMIGYGSYHYKSEKSKQEGRLALNSILSSKSKYSNIHYVRSRQLQRTTGQIR